MERHAVIVMLTFGALLVAVWGLIANRPTGLVPPEDQGYVLAVVSLPPAAALERTNAAMSALTRIAREVPGVDGVVYISGFNLLTGQAVSYNGTAFIRLKPWDQRKARSEAGRQPRAHADGTTQRANQGRASARPQPAAHPRAEHGRRLHLRAAEPRRRRTPRSCPRSCRAF